MIQGQAELMRAFSDLQNNFADGGKTVGKQLASAYEQEVWLVDAINTGRFLRSIGEREIEHTNEFSEYLIDSSRDSLVTYDGYVERGTKFMQARYPAKRGIEKTDLEQTFNYFVGDAFGGGFIL